MKLRIAKKKDAEQMLQIYEPFIRDNAVSFETEVPSIGEFQKRMALYMRTYPWWVCEHENKIIGYAYALAYRDRKAYQWSCESSVYVKKDFRKKGIARVLYWTLLETLKMQGLVNVFAVITFPNPASLKFHRSLGFKKFAVYENAGYKFGKWHDVHWYVKQLTKPARRPKEPIPFSELAVDFFKHFNPKVFA